MLLIHYDRFCEALNLAFSRLFDAAFSGLNGRSISANAR